MFHSIVLAVRWIVCIDECLLSCMVVLVWVSTVLVPVGMVACCVVDLVFLLWTLRCRVVIGDVLVVGYAVLL